MRLLATISIFSAFVPLGGAEDHWAYLPPSEPALEAGEGTNPIDAMDFLETKAWGGNAAPRLRKWAADMEKANPSDRIRISRELAPAPISNPPATGFSPPSCINHEKLTYRYSGRDFRLTDVFGNVVHDIIA